jgi:hypothetical protein
MAGFSDDPITQWLTEYGADRRMKILENFWFIDGAGKRWEAPKGSIINGASIPEALWSSVGSPYTGDYRRAAIVHDVACGDPTVSRTAADDMFYEACLAGGCSLLQAKLLYAGVRVGTWAASRMHLMAPYALSPGKPALPSSHTEAELVVRAKYTVLADRLRTTPDDLPQIKAVVDEDLSK